MSFKLIEAEDAHYPKALMCRALGLSRSGHHPHSTRGPSRRAIEQQQLDVLVAAIFAELGGRSGAPRMQREPRHRGHRTSRERVAASMARQELVARPKRRWRTTTDSHHREPAAPNRLGRDFTASAPDRVWVADTTCLPVLGGFLFLCLVLDLFSRKVVGFRRLLAAAGAVQSMSRRDVTSRTVADADPALFTFIEGYYNARRFHSTNDYRSLNQTEADWRIGRWPHNLGVREIGASPRGARRETRCTTREPRAARCEPRVNTASTPPAAGLRGS